jgi:hypothetical protein
LVLHNGVFLKEKKVLINAQEGAYINGVSMLSEKSTKKTYSVENWGAIANEKLQRIKPTTKKKRLPSSEFQQELDSNVTLWKSFKKILSYNESFT